MVAKNVKTTVMNSNWMRPFHLHPCPRLEVIVDVDRQANMIMLTLWSVWSKMCQDRSYGLEQIVYSMKGSTCPFWSWWSGKTEISIVPLHENVSRPLDGLDCNLCGSRRKCPFDLESVDKQRRSIVHIVRMCQDRFWTWMKLLVINRIVHVDLEEMETERKIVHVHEDLRSQVNCEGLIFTLFH